MMHKEQYRMRSGLIILPEQSEKLEQQLVELQQKVPANLAVLVDVTGQIVVAKGEHARVNLVMLGSLVAGDLAASQEIARLTGEYEDFQIVLREGQKNHIFIAEAGPHMAMLVQVGNEVPLGWARMLIQKAGRTISEIVDAAPETPQPEWEMEDMDDDLSNLFEDALDDVWLE